ncbi:MAG: glutamine synthetase beta-grasp domain-containing protein, partial [Ktedonobacteraceae bacterium]
MAEEKEQAKREFILAAVEAEGVGFVNLEFTDVVGMAKCVTIPVEQLPDCLIHGKWFDGSAIEGFARVAESDMYLFPDLDTFTILPGRIRPHEIISSLQFESDDRFLEAGAVARIICDVYTPNGERFDGDPRATLSHALDLANSIGFNFLVAPELEFFLLHLEGKTPMPLPHDR